MKYLVLLIVMFAVLSPVAQAEHSVRLIAVQGESRVEIEPNRAILSIEIKQTLDLADAARQAVSATLKKAVNVFQQHGVAEKNIEKTQILQGPNYQWQDNKRMLNGYSASVQLQITLDDLEQLAKIADALAKFDDLSLVSMAFARSDQAVLQAEQRKLALLNAKQKASDMLAVYNETLGPVLTIRDGGLPPPIAYGKMEMRMVGNASEPAVWEKVTISADVQVEFAIE